MASQLTPREKIILDRLVKGPLRACDFAEVVQSQEALKVHIVSLRKKGFAIITTRDKNEGDAGRPGTYHLGMAEDA